MTAISWNEVRDRAVRFSREWAGATAEERDKQTFWNEFFEVFGVPRKSVATFEQAVASGMAGQSPNCHRSSAPVSPAGGCQPASTPRRLAATTVGLFMRKAVTVARPRQNVVDPERHPADLLGGKAVCTALTISLGYARPKASWYARSARHGGGTRPPRQRNSAAACAFRSMNRSAASRRRCSSTRSASANSPSRLHSSSSS